MAELQERIEQNLLNGQAPEPEDLAVLSGNLWVKIAYYLAPGNLVLRNLCLQALLDGNSRIVKVRKTFLRLAYYRNRVDIEPLWAEGYGYWGYSKYILMMYLEKFRLEIWKILCGRIEQNFLKCSYERRAVLYPPPFGDLMGEITLDTQDFSQVEILCSAGNLEKYDSEYRISAWPVGLNCHAQKGFRKIEIKDGIPAGFKFYKGYGKKYKNTLFELWDMFDIRRIFSIPRMLFVKYK